MTALDILGPVSHHHGPGHHVRPASDQERGAEAGHQVRQGPGVPLPARHEEEHHRPDRSHLQTGDVCREGIIFLLSLLTPSKFSISRK